MTHRQQKYRTRHPLLRWLAVLLALGILLVAVFFRSRIARAQYPCRYADTVTRYAELYDIDPLVLYAFIRTESNFNPNAQSDAGARGLMQITEVTFDWIKLKIAPDEALTFDDLFDPETNIRFGSYFVAYCLQRYGGDLATAECIGDEVGYALVLVEQCFEFFGRFHRKFLSFSYFHGAAKCAASLFMDQSKSLDTVGRLW